MTVLPDHKIASEIAYGELEIEPVNLQEQLQPASLDIRLGNKFEEFEESDEIISLDTDITSEMLETHVDDNGKVIVYPGDFYLANTKESFSFPDNIMGELTGRSSVGRLGITVHQTAGLFDPGFSAPDGVLEIANVSNRPVELEPGMRIAQMKFTRLEGSANNPYNSEDNKYQNQEGAVASKINHD